MARRVGRGRSGACFAAHRLGIFNFTITVPQIVIGLTGGAIVKYCFASDAADMLALAGVFMLLAAVSVFLVKEHKAQ